jgi:hypothetical protein
MPPFGPIKRRDLIAYLRQLDFALPVLWQETPIYVQRGASGTHS